MRKAFEFGANQVIGHWFPQHMGHAQQKILNQVRKVDCLLEVHDARIPLTGRNMKLKNAIGDRQRILVLNKCDLAPEISDYTKALQEHYRSQHNIYKTLFTNCKLENQSFSSIIPACVEAIESGPRYNREGNTDYVIMIVGIPNVGKSTIINRLRRKYLNKEACASVGSEPGHTKSVMFRVKVCDHPRVFLIDTPGVLNPNIASMEEGLKLAICNTVSNIVVNNAMTADYLLFLLNQKLQTQYLEHYQLKTQIDDVQVFLQKLAVRKGFFKKQRFTTGTGDKELTLPNYEQTAHMVLKDFREGRLGKFIIDDMSNIYTNSELNVDN